MPDTPDLVPEENCWQCSQIARGGFALSGKDYFRAFRQAVCSAEHEVVVLAWDLSKSIEMIRDTEEDDGYPSKLGDFLVAVLDEKPELKIRILLWDFSVIYVAERDWLPFASLWQSNHPRLELVSDSSVPAGASHHQKLVIVDGALSMCGGLDLAICRWDSVEHQAEDERRINPKNESYQPYHDIQFVATGEVTKALRDLASYRWKRATGDPLPPIHAFEEEKVVWPESVPVAFKNKDVAIALTYSKYQSYPALHQIERLYLDLISCAKTYIYIENQYLSSQTITDALCERLRDPKGPEIVLLLTLKAGWAEESTMGIVRNRLLEKLREADCYNRFRCFYPCVGSKEHEQQVYVHAKLMIVDQKMLTFGSANLSNRSMRVDSELNLAILEEEENSIPRDLLERLLTIHLRCSESKIRQEMDTSNSLIQTIDKLNNDDGHRLEPLLATCDSDFERQVADSKLLDPDEPLSPIHNVWDVLQVQGEILWKNKQTSPYLKYLKIATGLVAFIVAVLTIAHLWKTGLSQEQATTYLTYLKDSPAAIPLVTLIFIIGGMLAVPINLLIVATALTFGPWIAIGCGFIGAMLSAGASFSLGHHLGKPLVRKIIGKKLDVIINSLKERGVASMVIIRLLPIAPFGLINLVAGVSGLRFSVFMIGSAIGMLPGLVTVVLATTHFQKAIEDPSWERWLIFILLISLIIGMFIWIRKRFT